jgi:signal peptidase I
MLPTLRDGDRLLVRAVRAGSPPRPGSLIVVRLPGGRPEAVKRLTGRQGGGWWVERDNPAEGADSWLVGAIPDDDVLGVVRARLWPWPRRFVAHRAPANP